MDDNTPPRVFNIVTSSKVKYNMDFVEYLIRQEIDRRKVANESVLSPWELNEFRRTLIVAVILSNDIDGAIKLRPQSAKTFLRENYDKNI
ncbi:MAG: hypothetical protein DDT31_00704 [Syntrophomonadaceae bacterium]|nr:hypothetical protein [Bacillota bacterium]